MYLQLRTVKISQVSYRKTLRELLYTKEIGSILYCTISTKQVNVNNPLTTETFCDI